MKSLIFFVIRSLKTHYFEKKYGDDIEISLPFFFFQFETHSLMSEFQIECDKIPFFSGDENHLYISQIGGHHESSILKENKRNIDQLKFLLFFLNKNECFPLVFIEKEFNNSLFFHKKQMIDQSFFLKKERRNTKTNR